MIAKDQPTCFPADVLVIVSSRSDGTVLDRAVGVHNPNIVTNRTKFCETNGVSYGDVVFQRIVYDEARSYELIAEVDTGSTTRFTSEVVADALFTRSKNIGMLLPVADCAATVIYDPTCHFMALAHLGRHSTLTNLTRRLVDHFIMNGSKAEDLIVWMGPSAHRETYRLEWFDRAEDPGWRDFFDKKDDGYYLDLPGYNHQQFARAGISPSNIHISPVDTVSNPDYFSHSDGETTGRIAVLAMMR